MFSPKPEGEWQEMSNSCLIDLMGLHAAAPGEGNHPADGLALGRGAAAGLAHGGEELEEPLFVLVDRHIQRSAAGLHPVGPALEGHGPVAERLLLFRRRLLPFWPSRGPGSPASRRGRW